MFFFSYRRLIIDFFWFFIGNSGRLEIFIRGYENFSIDYSLEIFYRGYENLSIDYVLVFFNLFVFFLILILFIMNI